MVEYNITCEKAHRHFIRLEARFPSPGKSIQLQLPAWRPGRYELGNFARNIREWQAFDTSGEILKSSKKTKDLWEVQCEHTEMVSICYTYYANELNAGSTLLDENQLYINPVNCFLYNPNDQNTPFEITFSIPDDYEIATGMPAIGKHKLRARDVQQLMDCPLIASNSLTHLQYDYKGIVYHIWVEGKLVVDHNKFIEDHRIFTVAQVDAFGSIPCEDYHFLYQFPAHYVRHGVEHENSTVIAMGPEYELLNEKWYNELLGISCHELYHTWNIKNIRPLDMWPYDFSRENYSRLGYVAEGVTTYFGDQYLHRCDFFDDKEYLRRLAQLIERHLHNYGRFNLSVADSSFDTWLDGYSAGVPWRKVSIYNEGALCAFICDIRIIENTNGRKSLDDVMVLMYERFGQKRKGYTEQDYKSLLEEVGACSFDDVFNNLIWGTKDYSPFLDKALKTAGLNLIKEENTNLTERFWGLKVTGEGIVVAIAPDSPADQAKLWLGDKVLSFNGNSGLAWNLQLQEVQSGLLEFSRNNEVQTKSIATTNETFYPQCTLKISASEDEKSWFSFWKNR